MFECALRLGLLAEKLPEKDLVVGLLRFKAKSGFDALNGSAKISMLTVEHPQAEEGRRELTLLDVVELLDEEDRQLGDNA